MLRRALTSALALAGCATPSVDSLTKATREIHGDFDGDGQLDAAFMREDNEGALRVEVVSAADPAAPVQIWGGDITSLPHFSIETAPPGMYHTACDLYGGCPANVPVQVTLTHDGIFVREVDRANYLLYYWDGAAFQNIIVAE